jgi:divalent metal cation (Fe/Co/Zn/Cd) transporter
MIDYDYEENELATWISIAFNTATAAFELACWYLSLSMLA